MAEYTAIVIVPVEYSLTIEADSLEEAREAVEDMEGEDIAAEGCDESKGTARILSVELA